MRRWNPALVGGLAVLLGVTACGERGEPLDREVSPYPVVVRGAGERDTVLNERPERIVALDAGSADLVAALGAADRLVGLPADSPIAAAAEAEEVVRASGEVLIDAVAGAEPDLIIATAQTDPVDVAVARRKSGAGVYVQPSHSVADVERAALELGLALGEPLAGRRLAARIARAVRAVEDRIAGRERRRVFLDTGFLVSARETSLLADIAARAGGETVVTSGGGADPYTPCEVVRLRPDVVLTTARRGPLVARLRRARGCRAGRLDVFEVSPSLVERAGPRVGEAVRTVARLLHADAFR